MAYNNWEQLQLLVNLLDDKRNDIFLHVDLKSLNSFQKSERVKCKNAQLFLAKSMDVRWSDISQTDAEVSIFRQVLETGTNYTRIHLISGMDLPIKSQDSIHSFFKGRDEEFINVNTDLTFVRRIKYYHFFVRERRSHPMTDVARRLLLVPQLPFVDRLRYTPLRFAWGANWCSLTGGGIRELVEKYPKYRHMFKYTTSSDELYKQMILLNCPSVRIAKEGMLRYVDFSAGKPSPKTLRMEDFSKLETSQCLFARKFDMRVDPEVIRMVCEHLN